MTIQAQVRPRGGGPDELRFDPEPQQATGKAPNLLFLHPKTLVDSWPVPVDTLGEMIKAPSAVYPILAATISHLPIAWEIFDGYVTRETLADYKRRLARADIIAISVMSPLKSMDTELTIRLAKRLNPDVCIILGGNHATAWAERWLERGADFVVVGEGEKAFQLLMETILAGSELYDTVPNLVYRDRSGTKHRTSRAPLVDLDSAPMPDWSSFNFRPYGLGLTSGFTAAIEVSRGCPHRCDFCNINTYWEFKQRYKSIDRVIEEVVQLHKLGVREFIFTDDNFGGDHRFTVRLLEAMCRLDLGMRFGSFLRGDTIHRNPGFAELAAKAGMRFCLMGIETLDTAWLKQHRKGVRANDVLAMYSNVYKLLNRNGIYLVGLFISPPAPSRTPYSGMDAEGVVCDYHVSANLTALRGSQLFDKLNETQSVAKDMFYHDWNLPSIVLPAGEIQTNQKTFADLMRENVSFFAMRSYVSPSSFRRRFRWRPIGVIAERLACTTMDDLRRFAIAADKSLPVDERQQRIAQSVLSEDAIDKVMRKRWWKSPLGLRNGLWSEAPSR